MKKLTLLVLFVGLIAFLYGCCSHSDKVVYVNPQADMALTQRTVIIDDHGRLPMVTFSSGATFVSTEENTLQSGIKVILTEQEVTSQNLGYFSDSKNVYMYKISAVQDSSKSAGSKTYVTTFEKPIKVTLPTKSETGLCYLCIRESDTDPWRFFRVGAENENIVNMVFNRASTNIAPKECSFLLYRLGISFCLVTYNENKAKELPETIVDSLIASSAVSIQVKDGRYLEDLQIKGILRGLKLGNIKPSDFRTRITYRNNMANEAPIKVNGVSVIQTNKSDKTVPGYTYYHTFLVDNITGFSLISTDGDFDFILNLSGIDIQYFPSGFLLEFYNNIDSENVLPYSYTEFYTLNKIEQGNQPEQPDQPDQPDNPDRPDIPNQPDVYTIVYNLDGGEVADPNPTTYGEASETFILNNPTKVGYDFIGWSNNEIAMPQIDVSIEQGSTGNKVFTANYTPITYNIVYTLNDGILATVNPTSYDITSATIILTNPTKEGYLFTGWTGSNGDEPQTIVIIDKGSTGNKSFVSNWTAESSIFKVLLNKGTGIAEVSGEGQYEVGSNVTASCTMLPGYEFDFWTGNNVEPNFDMPPYDVIMQANARLKSYSIDCNLDGGIVAIPNQTNYNLSYSDITLVNPTKTGYDFLGWTGSNGEVLQTNVTIVSGSIGDKHYVASYTPISYTIAYDLGKNAILGEGVNNPVAYDITSATLTINNPTRHNFNFIGWEGSDIAEGTASYSLSIPLGSYGNKTYVASWTLKNVITFNLSESVVLELRKCPAGIFTMGCPTTELGIQSWTGEGIGHQVKISQDFWTGTYEVTQDQYFAIMGTNPSSFKDSMAPNVRPTTTASYPVELVSWNEIMTGASCFIDKINTQLASQIPDGYRFDLPTEAQWEYACRAGTNTSLNNNKDLTSAYDNCPNLNEIAWYYQNWGINNTNTHSVGALASNTWGLYDMHGNVWEWCKDYFNTTYYSECLEYGIITDPIGPVYESVKVRRGGGWYDPAFSCRSAYRNSNSPDYKSNCFGFRLVLVKIQ